MLLRTKLKRKFQNYFIIYRLSGVLDRAYQASMFLATIIEEANIYDELKFNSEEDRMKLDIVIKNLKKCSYVNHTKPTNLTNFISESKKHQ